ncbi:MAG: hypothetical protein K5756_03435 [Clostridiales bacterium]|nr:hypothetical protein [Clostridiales bacterium]
MREVITAAHPLVIEGLKNTGIKAITVERSPFISGSLSTHSDMLTAKIGDCIILDRSQKLLYEYFKASGRACVYSEKIAESGYPDDVPLNCAVVGNNLICCKSAVSKILLEKAENSGFNIINVNQGYAKCSTCVVDENAVITDDISIHKACGANNIDSLLVSKGSVSLEGHNYGFIGGCSGLIGEGLLAFCGDISTHTDYENIRDFLEAHNVKDISLFEGNLIDIGGIIAV